MPIEVSPEKTRIGWIGTGVMGRSMCGHLLAAGYRATIFSRTKEKAAELVDRGAKWATSPRDVASASDVVISIVGFPSDVRQVLLGDAGALAGCKTGNVIVDMTTSEPSLAVEIAAQAKQRGVVSIDAPVSGGDVGARNATLSIMIGGDADTVAALEPIWKTMGAKWIRQGGPGAGQHTKMVNQMLIAANMVGVCEALLYAQRAGLDPLTVIRSVGSGAAASWSINNLGPKIAARDFAPGFYVEHFLKDMDIALREGRRMGLALPGLELAERLYREVAALGHGRSGTQALILAVERLASLA